MPPFTNNLLLPLLHLFSSPSLHRRGYAVASDISVRRGLESIRRGNSGILVKKVEEDGGVNNKGSSSSEAFSSVWAPDPVTGYYRPINNMNEIDPADLRNMLLNPKLRSSSSSSSSH